MKLELRSLKSKEKFADSLMSLANAIHGATLISVFVFPLTAFISAMFTGVEPFSFLTILNLMNWPNVAVFAVVYLLPSAVGFYAKEKAMDLYDEVEKSTSNNSSKRIYKRCKFIKTQAERGLQPPLLTFCDARILAKAKHFERGSMPRPVLGSTT